MAGERGDEDEAWRALMEPARAAARRLVAAGGAQLIDDKGFTADFVRRNVFPLLGSTRLADMAAASQSLGRAGAARALADLALEQVKEAGNE